MKSDLNIAKTLPTYFLSLICLFEFQFLNLTLLLSMLDFLLWFACHCMWLFLSLDPFSFNLTFFLFFLLSTPSSLSIVDSIVVPLYLCLMLECSFSRRRNSPFHHYHIFLCKLLKIQILKPPQMRSNQPIVRKETTNSLAKHIKENDSFWLRSKKSYLTWRRKALKATMRMNIPILDTDNLSTRHQSFIVVIDAIEIPTSVQEAMRSEHWTQAMREKMDTLERNSTWEIVDKREDKKALGCRWIFTMKHKVDR